MICVELTKMDEGCTLKKSEHCYTVWKKKRRCENCISQEVLRTHKPQTKIETRESDIYYVLALFIEVDGGPYSLELVKRIKSDDMFERENVLNQLPVRNRQVYMDSITKVYNRRYYDERLKNLEGWFSFAMIDMDNFKHINDQYGHLEGDAALVLLAGILKKVCANYNGVLARYGGDEFCIACGCNSVEVRTLIASIQRELDAANAASGKPYQIEISIGCARLEPDIATVHDLIDKADQEMYHLKTRKHGTAPAEKQG